MKYGERINYTVKNIIIFLLLVSSLSCSTTGQNEVRKNTKTGITDTLKPTTIELIPPFFEVPKPSGRFVTETLKIKNTGENLLVINKVEASCYCGSFTVLNSRIEPGVEGKILLNVNMDGLYGDNNIVQFTIHSNAKSSPSAINITILKSQKDSTDKK
ncbi:MAG: DUF1573 domain-containing protein [Ignavibacteriae bacterium]|nr:DUF1573 domain-containing protein [Ignavibacteriota bacterium]